MHLDQGDLHFRKAMFCHLDFLSSQSSPPLPNELDRSTVNSTLDTATANTAINMAPLDGASDVDMRSWMQARSIGPEEQFWMAMIAPICWMVNDGR
jgi:hypothetical protein